MLTGGHHLARILSALGGRTTNKRFQVVRTSRGSSQAESSFADALGLHPHVFDRLYVAVVRAGELSGSLPIVLDALTIYLEKSAQLRRKVLGAVGSPRSILAVTTGMVFTMIVGLVQVLKGVYAGPDTRRCPRPPQCSSRSAGVIRGYTW